MLYESTEGMRGILRVPFFTYIFQLQYDEFVTLFQASPIMIGGRQAFVEEKRTSGSRGKCGISSLFEFFTHEYMNSFINYHIVMLVIILLNHVQLFNMIVVCLKT